MVNGDTGYWLRAIIYNLVWASFSFQKYVWSAFRKPLESRHRPSDMILKDMIWRPSFGGFHVARAAAWSEENNLTSIVLAEVKADHRARGFGRSFLKQIIFHSAGSFVQPLFARESCSPRVVGLAVFGVVQFVAACVCRFLLQVAQQIWPRRCWARGGASSGQERAGIYPGGCPHFYKIESQTCLQTCCWPLQK